VPLTTGSRVGSYEVIAPIGAGGMGEVYRRARFEREAQLLAPLNHPHIAQIYGLEDAADGVHALVMELVDGPTLADRIASSISI
jgi:serine/threonine-protein kinase